MKHGKRYSNRTRVLRYTDKPPQGKPLNALRWTPGAVDTCGPDAPATQAHTGHTTPPRRAGGGGRQPPNHTAQVASAPRPASGPDTSGTAQPPESLGDLGHPLGSSSLGGRVAGATPQAPMVPLLESGGPGENGGGELAGEAGVRGHVSIKHQPVTDVNNIPRHSCEEVWDRPTITDRTWRY